MHCKHKHRVGVTPTSRLSLLSPSARGRGNASGVSTPLKPPMDESRTNRTALGTTVSIIHRTTPPTLTAHWVRSDSARRDMGWRVGVGGKQTRRLSGNRVPNISRNTSKKRYGVEPKSRRARRINQDSCCPQCCRCGLDGADYRC